ncbi:MAG: UDP-glucose/GDP-mannose dehydrogenase family protein [Gammaproteobacteria bacterium]|nr:UDP-glucose/GDP-mannose dehydrogenase family protein [Gammaproteobacteria bacterium]
MTGAPGMNIVVVGAGYVGLVCGACFAQWGNRVTCVDIDAGKIRRLNAGDVPIHEPGLEPLIAANVRDGRLFFTDRCDDARAAQARAPVQAVFIAVDTPPGDDGRPDRSAVLAAAGDAVPAFGGHTVVAVKSTVPVGTCGAVREAVAQAMARDGGAAPLAAQFDVVSNPEFLREGRAVDDFMRPDRVVIGADNAAGRDVLCDLYRPLAAQGVEFVHTSSAGAELIKYGANAFLAAKVGLVNEIADLCEALGLDIGEVAAGIGLDPRIGADFLRPGPGFGGSCFPKDTLGLLAAARGHDVALPILESVVRSNEARKQGLAERVRRALGGLSGKTVAVLGLAFKAGTDDVRCSPALDLVAGLLRGGAAVKAFDPAGMDQARRLLRDVEYCTSALDAAAGADALVVHTDWEEFAALDWGRVKSAMRGAVVYDFRNLCELSRMRELGFHYFPVGGAPLVPEKN